MAGVVLIAAFLSLAGVDEPAQPLDDPVTFSLLAMAEPPIGQLPKLDQAFRWVWMRSFHGAVVVRVQKQGARPVLIVKALDRPYGLGPDGRHTGKMTVNRQRVLTEEEWNRVAELRRRGFWTQPSGESDDVLGLDGADWIMDGVAWGERHTVVRWSPDSGPFRELCLAMLKLSGLTVSPDDIY